MKRVRCPKCDHFITFDETKYQQGQTLIFTCPECNKQFGVRMGQSRLFAKDQKAGSQTTEDSQITAGNDKPVGWLIVIENVFHYKQVIPLTMGDNIIGRYQKGNNINCPIETVDPSVDIVARTGKTSNSRSTTNGTAISPRLHRTSNLSISATIRNSTFTNGTKALTEACGTPSASSTALPSSPSWTGTPTISSRSERPSPVFTPNFLLSDKL